MYFSGNIRTQTCHANTNMSCKIAGLNSIRDNKLTLEMNAMYILYTHTSCNYILHILRKINIYAVLVSIIEAHLFFQDMF